MKVYLNRYRDNWISPNDIIDRVFFWTDWSRCHRWTLEQSLEDEKREKTQFVERPEWADQLADALIPVSRAIQKILDVINPKIDYVKIDRWDTWSMDSTLSRIILPMLRQLQKDKHGAPLVDDEDVPEHLRSTAAPAKENEYDTDGNHFLRWDWVMDELIWTFEQLHPDNDWEQQYYSGEHDILWVPVDKDGNEVPRGEHKWSEMRRGPNDTFKVDHEGLKAHQARINNGLRLFGKYYQGLWD